MRLSRYLRQPPPGNLWITPVGRLRQGIIRNRRSRALASPDAQLRARRGRQHPRRPVRLVPAPAGQVHGARGQFAHQFRAAGNRKSARQVAALRRPPSVRISSSQLGRGALWRLVVLLVGRFNQYQRPAIVLTIGVNAAGGAHWEKMLGCRVFRRFTFR